MPGEGIFAICLPACLLTPTGLQFAWQEGLISFPTPEISTHPVQVAEDADESNNVIILCIRKWLSTLSSATAATNYLENNAR